MSQEGNPERQNPLARAHARGLAGRRSITLFIFDKNQTVTPDHSPKPTGTAPISLRSASVSVPDLLAKRRPILAQLAPQLTPTTTRPAPAKLKVSN